MAFDDGLFFLRLLSACPQRRRRGRPAHPGTGLPCGATLIIAQTKEDAWRWSDRLEAGADGLSALSYVMPLRERRRLTAKQAAAFDVVVTTYDVSLRFWGRRGWGKRGRW